MWLYLVGVVLVILGIAGAFAGGIFTLILIPIGLVVIASAAGYSLFGHAAQDAGGGSTRGRPSTSVDPLPHSGAGDSGHVASSPEGLADARRTQQ